MKYKVIIKRGGCGFITTLYSKWLFWWIKEAYVDFIREADARLYFWKWTTENKIPPEKVIDKT